MAVNLQEFLGQVNKNGGIRTQNLFELYVSSGYPDVDEVLSKITMYGQNFEIPSRTIDYNVVGFKAYDVPIAGKFSMTQEHEITVNADMDGEIRRAFLAWQGKTVNPAISDGSLFEGDRNINLGSVIRIHLLGNNGEISEIYKLLGVKMKNVGPLTVSNTEAGVSTFTCSFSSLYWEIESGTVSRGSFKDQK